MQEMTLQQVDEVSGGFAWLGALASALGLSLGVAAVGAGIAYLAYKALD